MGKQSRRKRDTGIAVLPNGVKINEETRDRIQARVRSRTTPPPELTTADLRRNQFSGIRHNRLSRYVELWVLGRKAGELHEDSCTPDRLATLMEQVFATNGTLVTIDDSSTEGR